MDFSLIVPIVEIFGSFQGEGPYAGRRALFIRMAGCNLVGVCKWCDTDFRVREMVNVREVADKIDTFVWNGGSLVVFTGGEPTIYQDKIMKILDNTKEYNFDVQIETNGTIPLRREFVEYVDVFVVSPKRGFEELAYENYIRGLYMKHITHWKFVVGSVPKNSTFWDFDSIGKQVEHLKKYGVLGRNIWLMPYGADVIEMSKNAESVWNKALELGVNYSDRIHIRVFGESATGV